MSEQLQPVGVIGVGWVGLVTAACFAELGHRVVARDILPEKVEALSRGEVAIHEPGLEDLLQRNVERITFTTEMNELLEQARLLFLCVDTPPTYSGDADLSRVRSVVQELPEGSEHVLIMKSTVPAGTGESIRRDIPDLAYVSCPEFLKEGTAVEDFMHPDRVVGGSDPGDEVAAGAGRRVSQALRGGDPPAARRDPPRRRRQRRDDQARLQRLPRDQDLLHQRDRQRLRGGRRRRRPGRAADGAGPARGLLLPAGGDRLRRQLLPQGRQRPEDAGREPRLPL